MSNHLAIASVTATLKNIVETAASDAVGGAVAEVGRPVAATPSDHKVLIYLYQVTPNAALRNADLPTRDSDRRLLRRPQAALDLHYLLSFYGDNKNFEPERMLGAVVRDLHARPILARDAIRSAVDGTVLNASNLDAAVEHVKFTPTPISLEDLTKLWSMMIQVPHVLSVAYVGTVVLIEAEETPQAPLPVLHRGEDDRGIDSRVGPFPRFTSVWIGAPASADVAPRLPSLPCAELGARLLFSGVDLGGGALRLRFAHVALRLDGGGLQRVPVRDIDVPAAKRSASSVEIDLPDDAAAQTDWVAGIYSVSAELVRGDVTQPTTGALPLALAPRVTGIAPNPARRVAGDVELTITCRPRVLAGQHAVLVLADREVPAAAFAGPTDTLKFVVANAPLLQKALVRLRVDDVDSLPFRFDEITRGFVFDDAQRLTIQ